MSEVGTASSAVVGALRRPRATTSWINSPKPGSTIGFERRFNPALKYGKRDEFVRFVLSDLPPQPAQFAENRRINLGLTT